MPAIDRDLAGDQQGSPVVAIIDDLEQIAALLGIGSSEQRLGWSVATELESVRSSPARLDWCRYVTDDRCFRRGATRLHPQSRCRRGRLLVQRLRARLVGLSATRLNTCEYVWRSCCRLKQSDGAGAISAQKTLPLANSPGVDT